MKQFKDIIDDPKIRHLELGAGINSFGKIFFAPCYATDLDDTNKPNIDFCCDANDLPLPFPDKRFDKIILCNPYGYGFNTSPNLKIKNLALLQELVRILAENGEIIVISSVSNKWGKSEQITKIVEIFNQQPETIQLNLSFCDYVATNFVKNGAPFKFYQVNGETETIPNEKTIITRSKPSLL